ncbi:U3 snoRNP protein [Coemansia sp. RSA 1813]|nr:U3 snoRNP protein [Coemansia sp. RSA 1646]KAJ2090815.1 U3 snoRNP protein [Coemansia sp. RSA 986]KAJ2216062.1 U3 snoRNP protein [Coemansia sp. RSA 487]KAJ2570478.1 U3 snoRNP protein [Coemansia sp. RSA 1813]
MDNEAVKQLNTFGGEKTFRFKSFKQRVDDIEINVSRRIVRDFDEPEEHGSYFAEALKKWGELNCTKDFTEFTRRVHNYHQSLAQILYHKEEIVGALEEYLSLDHAMVVVAMLDLLTTLARDLQDEVLPYYERLVRLIMPLIKVDSAEIVEAACNALAYLFKYLSKSLTKDLRPTFNLISPMLGIERQRVNVRRFSAESMAFLIRKLRGDALQQFVEHTVHYMLECPPNRIEGFRDGLALLYFECMRNVNTQMHSRASGVLSALLRELYKEEFTDAQLEDNDVYLLVLSVVKLSLHYVKRDTAEPIWSTLFTEYDMQTQAILRGNAERIQPFAALLGLLSSASIVRKGSRISEYKPVIQRCRTAFEISNNLIKDSRTAQALIRQEENEGNAVAGILASARIKWLSGILLQCDLTDLVSTGRLLLDMAFANESLDILLSMALTLARLEWNQWNQIMLPYLTKATVSMWPTHRETLLMFWSKLFQKELFTSQGASISSVVTSRGQILFSSKSAAKGSSVATDIPQSLLEWLAEPVDWSALAEQTMTIPTSGNDAFGGIDGDSSNSSDDASDVEEEEERETHQKSKPSKSPSDIVQALITKSAILTMLEHTAVDAQGLFNGLSIFAKHASEAIAELTNKLASRSEFLAHKPLAASDQAQGNTNSTGILGDDATEALGLFVPKSERLFWGPYYQLYPLVCLLGRSLKMEAEAAFHAPIATTCETLMDSWCQALDSVLPAHFANTPFIEGLYKLADFLRYATTAKKNGDQISPAIELKISAALSSEQLVFLMPLLENNLLSVQSSLRLKTLQLLSLFEQIPAENKPGDSSNDEKCDVIQLATDLESTIPNLDTYKDRLNRLRRMAVFSSNGRIPKLYENVFPYLAIAQFSVNLNLIWPETIKQVGLIAGNNTGLFWRATWKQLRKFNDQRMLIETGIAPEARRWLSDSRTQWSEQNMHGTQPKLDGHAMECPNLVRFDSVFGTEISRFEPSETDPLHMKQLQHLMVDSICCDLEHVNYSNIQKQLLKMLADVGAHAAESHSRQVVPSFLAFINYDFGWTVAFFRKQEGTDLDLDAELKDVYAVEFRGLLTENGNRTSDALCALWLKLFSKIKNPQSLYKASTLYSLFMRLLTRGDNDVQRSALDCLLAWREPEVIPYADHMRGLVDEKRFRDEINTFELGIDGNSVNIVHRKTVMPVIFRLLYGQMMGRGGKSSRKDGQRSRRMAILNALVNVSQEEMRMFVGIGLESFNAVLSRATPQERLAGDNSELFSLSYTEEETGDCEASDVAMDVDEDSSSQNTDISSTISVGASLDSSFAMEDVPQKTQLSFFYLLAEMIKQLGFKAVPVFHEALTILLSSIRLAQRQLDIANDELRELAEDKMEADDEDDKNKLDDNEESVASDESDLEESYDQEVEDPANADDSGNAAVAASSGVNDVAKLRKNIVYRKGMARSIRHLAVKCLTDMFALQPPSFDFTPYISSIYEVVIDPRIDNLSRENTQNSSALLLLFKSWSLTPMYFSYLAEYNPLAMRMLFDILVAPKVQPKVVTLVLDVLQAFLDYDADSAAGRNLLDANDAKKCAALVRTTIQSHVSQLLSHMRTCFNGMMQQTKSGSVQMGRSSVVVRQIHILSRISEYATKQTDDAKALLDLLIPTLKRPNSAVPEHTKGDVLQVMQRFISLVLGPETSTLSGVEYERAAAAYLDTISACFGRIHLDTARVTLSSILFTLAQIDRARQGTQSTAAKPTPLEAAAMLVEDINSYSTARIGEPDFDRRLSAYGRLNEELWNNAELLDATAWTPILHNLTYFAQDRDEMSIRSNAAFGISRYITRVSQAYQEDKESAETQLLGHKLISVVMPAIKYALASKEEIIRNEFLAILRRVVRECAEYFDQLRDLTVLESRDEEANFFYNIVHIQLHRRLRAVRRFRALITDSANASTMNEDAAMDVDDEDGAEPLAEEDAEGAESNANGRKAKQGKTESAIEVLNPLNFGTQGMSPISPANIRTIFMPLLENWALADNSTVVHDLANEAISTIGVIGAVLPWSQYNSAIRKYIELIKKSPPLEKRLTRLILALLDNFHFDLRSVKVDNLGRLVRQQQQPSDTAAPGSGLLAADNEDDDSAAAKQAALVSKNTHDENVLDSVVNHLLPMLKKKVTDVDEKSMALRAPVAMAMVRLMTALPVATMNAQLPGVLTTICNMLRARSQVARNATRDTLIRIAKFLGAPFFGFLVKELSASLTRDSQKHVLAYTIYTLLKEIRGQVNVGDLDYTLNPIVSILMQDIFGKHAEDKDAEEWTTKMREAKVHHGPDCFEILASITTFENVRPMLAPLRDILSETDTPKRTKAVDNVLRHISVGLNRNRTYSPKNVLVFSYNIINQYLAMSTKSAKDTVQDQQTAERKARLKPTVEDGATVYVKRTDVLAKRDYLQANAHRFVQFGLDIMHHGLRRNRFDVGDVEILGMIDPFVDLAGNGLYSRYNSIITICCKIWTILVRLPLPSIPAGIPVVIRRLFTIFRQASSTDSDMIQSCFKLLASLLRSKSAEKLMEDYKPIELPETTAGNGGSKNKGKKSGQPQNKHVSKNALLGENQLRDLIDFIRPDIEEPERQGTAFNLIRAILTRRMIVDSLYTLLDTIRELMITAQASNARELCRLTWFQFLMDYPLGEKRLTNAMSFIVQNATSYEFESGRTSALEVMGVIIDRFVDGILLPNAAEPFFLGLVLIIAKDESAKCREMASHLLPVLVRRFDHQRLARVWILLDQWSAGISNSLEPPKGLASGDEREAAEGRVQRLKMRELGRASLQCYGIIIEPLGERFAKRLPQFLSTIDAALSVSLKTWKEAEMQINAGNNGSINAIEDLEKTAAELHSGDSSQEDALAYWETAYMALNSFGRLCKAMPQLMFGSDGQSRIWMLAIRHLTHPHAWVRLSAARIFGMYASNADPTWVLAADPEPEPQELADSETMQTPEWDVQKYAGTPKYVLMSPVRLRTIVHSSTVQLGSRYLSEELGNQVVKNMYFIAKCFLACVPQSVIDGSGDSGARTEDGDGISEGEGNEEEDEEAADDGTKKGISKEHSLLWLIKRVCAIGRTELIRGRGSTSRRTYCFRWLAAIISSLPPPLLARKEYITPMVSILYRTADDEQMPMHPVVLPNGQTKEPAEQLAEIKALASEIIKLAQNRIGVTAFTAVLNKVQSDVQGRRYERREKRKVLAVADPELHARQKHKKHVSYKRNVKGRNSEAARKKIRFVVKKAPHGGMS